MNPKDQIEEYLKTLTLSPKDKNVELEVRYGHFVPVQNPRTRKKELNFISNVPEELWTRLMISLEARAKEEPGTRSENLSTVHIYEGPGPGVVRKIITGGREIFQRKIQLQGKDVPDYELRISLAQEITDSSLAESYRESEPKLIRTRQRYSYRRTGYQIDLTRVIDTRNNHSNYEVELEFKNPLQAIRNSQTATAIILKFRRELLDSVQDYTYSEKRQIVEQFKALWDNRKLINAIPLTRNEAIRAPLWEYSISPKVDGFHKILFVFQNQVWLIHGYNEYNYLGNLKGQDQQIWIILGELVSAKGSQNAEQDEKTRPLRFYVPYDVVVAEGRDITNLNYVERIANYYNWTQDRTGMINKYQYNHRFIEQLNRFMFETAKIKFFVKRVNPISNLPRQVLNIESNADNYPFPIDGTILTHSGPYVQKPNGPVVIYKLKRPELTSIDFKIQPRHNRFDLYCMSSQEPLKYSLFEGTPAHPNKTLRIVPDGIRLSGVHSFLPVTFDPQDPKPTDQQIINFLTRHEEPIPIVPTIFLIYEKPRPDKSTPNSCRVARSNWEFINNPITLASLRGDDLELYFTYHKYIKTVFLPPLVEGKVVLDLGIGKLGDFNRYTTIHNGQYMGAKLILGVEPNSEYLAEAELRHQNHPEWSRFKLLNESATHTHEVTNFVHRYAPEGVDVVVMMLSATFFWKDQHTLEALLDTIRGSLRPQGRLVIFTMDGAKVAGFYPEAVLNSRLNSRTDPSILSQIALDGATSRSSEAPENFGKIIDTMIKTSNRSEDESVASEKGELPPINIGVAQLALPNGLPRDVTQFGPGVPVDVTLPGSRTVIETQREYLVNLNNLESAGDFKMVNRPEFPRTVSLPVEYEFLAQLYTWAEFEYNPRSARQSTGSSRFNEPPVSSEETEESDPSKNARTPPRGATYSRMLSQDQVQTLQVSWTNRTVYRIGSIGDGRCLIHSFLNAFWPEYHHGDSDRRVKLAIQFRYELGQYVNKANSATPGYSYWMTVGDAFYLKSYLKYLEFKEIADADDPVTLLGFDPRPQQVVELLDSCEYLGQEAVHLIAAVTNIDLIVTSAYNLPKDQLFSPSIVTVTKNGPRRKIIAIIYIRGHFELLGIKTSNGIQTVFEPDDPFVRGLIDGFRLQQYQSNPVDHLFTNDPEAAKRASQLPLNDPARQAYQIWRRT
jgi:hypothetical protein